MNLKLKNGLEMTASFRFRQGELWYFQTNRNFLHENFGQSEIESYNGIKPEDYPHYSDNYTSEPTFFDARASKIPVKQVEEEPSSKNRDLVLRTIRTFACSQGFYSRLLRDIREAEESGEDLTDFYDQFSDCKTTLDVVMALEG